MPLRELHRQVAAIALRAAARHGFALGGGNALIAHGVISRPTQDVDLVTNREAGVGAATGPVEAALRREGFTATRQDRTAELADLFPAWATSWPNGKSPRLAASAQICSWPTSTAVMTRCSWTSGRSWTWRM
ncbi:MAG: nucleotidyl transferase AbiEii/AbiGii toxin family protein [Pseudonocardiaceae bacterium]